MKKSTKVLMTFGAASLAEAELLALALKPLPPKHRRDGEAARALQALREHGDGLELEGSV